MSPIYGFHGAPEPRGFDSSKCRCNYPAEYADANRIARLRSLYVHECPAGLGTALMLGRARTSVLVIDDGQPRNAPAAHMHGFLSRDGVPPDDLLETGRRDMAAYGGHLLAGRALSAVRDGDGS